MERQIIIEEKDSNFSEPFSLEGDKFKCPKCGSTNYRVKAGMFTDVFICLDCGYRGF